MTKFIISIITTINLIAFPCLATEVKLPLSGHEKAVRLFSKIETLRPDFLQLELGGLEKDDLIHNINQAYNTTISYNEELEGVDIWQHPSVTTSIRSGDCEDYAIAKWAHLLHSGIPKNAMRFVVGLYDNKSHLYLKVTLNENVYHLDNHSNDMTIAPIKDNDVIYEFDDRFIYLTTN